jgi:hypothetical protein
MKAARTKDEIHIHHDFPGGNIVVEEITGDIITLRPDLRDTEGHWFYWYFEVNGAQGRTLTLQSKGSIGNSGRLEHPGRDAQHVAPG